MRARHNIERPEMTIPFKLNSHMIVIFLFQFTGIENKQTCAASQNWNSFPVTMNTTKSPANVVTCSSTTNQIAIQGGTDSGYKDQKKLSLANRTTPSAFTQTFGGIEDFFLLREGKVNSLKSSTNALCTPPSKRELLQSVYLKFNLT